MYELGNEMRLDNNLSAYFSLKAVDRWLRLAQLFVFLAQEHFLTWTLFSFRTTVYA